MSTETKMRTPEKFRDMFIHSIEPWSEGQTKLIAMLKKLWDWDKAIAYHKADIEVNPLGLPFSMDLLKDVPYDRMLEYLKLRDAVSGEWHSKTHKNTLVVCGRTGIGKSCLTSAMLNTYNRIYPGGGVYVTLGDLHASAHSWDSTLENRLGSAPIVVIDELRFMESEFDTETRALLQRVVVTRYDNSKRTVLVSNLTGKDFADVLDPHVRSRLREGLYIQMSDDDMRSRARGTK